MGRSRHCIFSVLAMAAFGPGQSANAQNCHETHFRGYADIDDIRMYYEVHGDGHPVLLLHGGTFAGAESWSRTIPAIVKKHQVIVPDSRAHGRSTDSEKPLGYDLLTDNIVELMDHLNIQKAHVVGWSDGGVIGFNMALRYPDRLGRSYKRKLRDIGK